MSNLAEDRTLTERRRLGRVYAFVMASAASALAEVVAALIRRLAAVYTFPQDEECWVVYACVVRK